jgi:hypothetical protein
MTLSIPPFYEDACGWITAAFLEKSKAPIFLGAVHARDIQKSYADAWWEKASEKEPTLNQLSFEQWREVVRDDLIEAGALPECKLRLPLNITSF